MKRALLELTQKEYDLVVVGGGIFGVCAAWDASLRGLSVALVEKADFCHATSANHFKMAHGGIRYLQHADLYRVRESSHERSALLRIAPHLVRPIPIVVPTYGHGIKSKEFLGTGLFLYEALTLDRNRGIKDPSRRIPRSTFIPREELLQSFPGIVEKGLTGGALIYDGQIYDPPRLALSFLRAAVSKGTDAANYVEVIDFIHQGNRVSGVKARDVLDGVELEIRAKIVLNAAGPWAHRLLERGLGLQLNLPPTFSRDLAFVVNGHSNMKYALAFSTKTKDADTILDRGGRHLFAVPWRDYMLIGVWHRIFHGPPEEITVTEKELQGFIQEVKEAHPGFDLTLPDIRMINTGLTLFGEEGQQDLKSMSFGKRSRLIDHKREHQIEGLVTLIGVRFTTGRGMAEKAVDLILKKLMKKRQRSITATTPIYGGHIDYFEEFLRQSIEKNQATLDAEVMDSLVRNYGSKFNEVLKFIDEEPMWAETLGSSKVLKAEVVHAVREEMAQKLSDVVFRRTDLGTGGNPADEALINCGNIIATEMGWDQSRLDREMQEVKNAFPSLS